MLFYEPEEDSIFRIRFAGTGLSVFKRFLSKPKTYQKRLVRLVAFKRTSEKGTWYEPQGVTMADLNDEQKAYMVALEEKIPPALVA